jgi:hypothetical protein
MARLKHAATLQGRAQAAVIAATTDVPELEPIGAGFRTVHFDTRAGTWRCTEEEHYYEAKRTRARILAARALEIMGADPQQAQDVSQLLPISHARDLVAKACPILGLHRSSRRAA